MTVLMRILKPAALVACLSLVCWAAAPSRGVFPAQLGAIDVSAGADSTLVILHLDASAPYRTARLPAPPRWYIDLRNTRIAPSFKHRFLPLEAPWVRLVRVAEDGIGNTRVVFDLESAAAPKPRVSSDKHSLVVEWPHQADQQPPAHLESQPLQTEKLTVASPKTNWPEKPSLGSLATPADPPPRFQMPAPSRPAASPQPTALARVEATPPSLVFQPPDGTHVLPAAMRGQPLVVPKQPKPKRVRRVNMPLAHLSVGQRVKIQGKRFQGKTLVAKEVELVEQDSSSFEIEGLVSKLDKRKGKFSIGPFRILISEKTKFQDRRRQPLTVASLSNGVRVKVKAKGMKKGVVEARTVRTNKRTRDTDFEIEAPIEQISLSKSEISVLPTTVRVNTGTEFKNFSFIGSDKYADDSKLGRFIRRDDDEQHPDPIRIGPVYVGGKTQFTFDGKRNLDLDENEPDSDDWYRSSGQVEIAAPLGEYSEVYAKFNFARSFYAGNDPTKSTRGDIRFREGFIYLGNFLHRRSLGLQVGRQRFRDKREWLFNERLDAVRLHVVRRKLKVELSVAKSIFTQSTSRKDQLYLIAYSEYRLPGRRYLGGYFVKRNDTSRRDEDPIWYGVSSRGRVTRKLDYWAELSQMRGRRKKRLLRGYAFDVGGSYELPLPWGSTISGGYAFGSGDKRFKDGVDGNFRQTRINDNRYRYNGLKRYRYYGVLLEPELFNMKIKTINYGIRPSREWSLDTAFHTYRQAVADNKLGDTQLDIDPSGKDPRLGKEVDFIVTIRKFRNIDVNFLMGVFFPGPAFKGAPPTALVFRPGIRYYF